MEHLFSMPIIISNVSGELKSSIGSLVRFYKIRRITPVQSMYGKGVFGKTLFNLINRTHEVAPENLSEKLGIQKKDGSGPDIPVKYEDWILLQNKVDKPKFSGILAI
jgi:hypothetical protein